MRRTLNAARSSLPLLALLAGCQSPPTGPGRDRPSLEPAPIPLVYQIAFIGDHQLHRVYDIGSGFEEVFHWSEPPEPLTPVWAPAGPDRIAFVMMWDYGDSVVRHVGLVSADGSGLQDLTPSGVRGSHRLRWSPDGTRIAFVEQATSTRYLMVVNADGSGLDTLVANPGLSAPAWSPAGDRLAYFAGTDHERTAVNERGIWSVKPDGTGGVKLRTVAAGNDIYDGLQYAPNGAKIAMCHHTGGGTIEVMNAGGTGLVALPLGCVNGLPDGPQWAPNGSRLLTVHGTNLWTVTPDGSALVQLTSDGTTQSRYRDPRWSRAGTRIAYVRDGIYNPGDNTVDAALFSMLASGSSRLRLTPGGMDVEAISYGPAP